MLDKYEMLCFTSKPKQTKKMLWNAIERDTQISPNG